MKIYEYKVRIIPPYATEGPEKAGLTEAVVEEGLVALGAEGFRLIRAEADGQGVMWLVLEKVKEVP